MKLLVWIIAGLLVASFGLTVAEAKPKQNTDKEIILAYADAHSIPRNVINYVAKRESGFRCSPGNPRYKGPLQVSPGSARALGYKSAEGPLNNCRAGLKYGMRHLKLCVNKVGANPKRAAHCHAMPAKYGVHVVWK